MRKAFLISFGIATVVAGAAAALWAYLFWTPTGRAWLRQLAETKIAGAVGGEVSIGVLGGKLPGAIILENVALTDNGETWLKVDRADLRWRPLAMFGSRVEIDAFHIDGARLLKTPPAKSDRQKPRGFELPDRLPNIVIANLSLADFEVADDVAGNLIRLDGGGAVRMGGRTLSINLGATSRGERDFLSARIERAGDALETRLTLKSEADGAFAAIARLGGPVFIDATGDGPLADYRLDFKASLGAYGQFDGAVSGDLEKMEEIGFAADAMLGEKLTNTARIIGPGAAIVGAFSPLEDGGELRVTRFQSALGLAEGTARWGNRNKNLETVFVKAAATLDEGWRPDIRPYIGDNISIDGELRPKEGAYVANGEVNASYFDAALKGIETDLRDYARGPADIVLKANESLPESLSTGAVASGNFTVLFGDLVEGTPVKLETAAGGTFAGDAHYQFDTRAFKVKGDISAPPEAIAAANSKLAAKNHASGAVDVRGTPESFSGTITAILPPLLFDGKPFPAARASLAFADAPASASGQISARAIDGSLRLGANFARGADGSMRASDIDYASGDFALKGSAALLAGGSGLEINLAYRGVGAAEPWPGYPLAGDFTAKGAIARGAAANSLSVNTGALASGNWSIESLSATAHGPSNRIALKASAGSLAVKGMTPAKKITATAFVDFSKALDMTLTSLTADVAGAPLKLSAPAAIKIDNSVTIDNFRAVVGNSGSISVDGAATRTRWRAKIVSRGAPVVSAASVLDLDVDLDTDRTTPATGAFTMSSLLAKTDNASVSGRIGWNGQSVTLSNDGRTEAFAFNLSFPAKLRRSPAISVDTGGALSGDARFSGRAETIAGFLPAALQSIEGALSFSGRASGTLAGPRLSGDLSLSGGAFTELSTGLSIVNVDATARAEGALSGSRIDFNSAGTGAGQKEKTIFANGTIAIGKDRRLASKVTLKGAKLTAGPVAEVEASGDIDLSGPFSDLLAKGDITVRSLDAKVFTPETTGLVDIKVVRLNGDGAPAVAASAAPQAAISYAIHIDGDDRIFIRGRGLESEWRASVDIAGRAEAPVVLGSMSMKNGEIAFAGRRFKMTVGEIAFDRLAINNPILDLRAEREAKSGTLTAIVIEGRARAPKISLSSTPALPKEDIMALILFDKPASELSAIESLQVAEGLAELGGIGPFGGNGVTGSARQALGLDLLNVNVDQADSAASSLTVGKYVADGLFVSATQDARGDNGSVRIEYEIDQSFTVETELRQDGDQKASVNWKHDF